MPLTQDSIQAYVDNFAFEVDYQFNDSYLPSSKEAGLVIVGLHSWDAETEEAVDVTPWLKVQFSDFNEKLEQDALQRADSAWLELMRNDLKG